MCNIELFGNIVSNEKLGVVRQSGIVTKPKTVMSEAFNCVTWFSLKINKSISVINLGLLFSW